MVNKYIVKEVRRLHEKPKRTTFQKRMNYFVETLRKDIKDGVLNPNEFLPSLANLSKIYELSINSIQKGLNILEAEKLIERLPRKGIKVKENHIYTKKVIRFGYYANLANMVQLPKLVKMFEAEHPQIKVELIPLQYENYKDVVNHYFVANMLDIVTITEINFHQLMNEADGENLFQLVEKNEAIYSMLYEAYTYKEDYYVTPFIFSPVVLCYQTKFFSEEEQHQLQQSQTWEQFIQFLNDKKNAALYTYPFYFKATANNRWPIFLFQSGLDFRQFKNAKNKWNEKQLGEAMKTSHKLIHEQKLLSVQMLSDDLNVEELFLKGNFPIILTTYYGMNYLRNSNIAYDIAPLPYVSEPGTILLTTGIAINKHTENMDEAQQFSQFLAGYEAQNHIRINTTSIPAVKNIAEKAIHHSQINQPKHYMLYKELMDHMWLLEDLHLTQNERIQLLNYLKLYWMGITDLQDTLTSFNKLYFSE